LNRKHAAYHVAVHVVDDDLVCFVCKQIFASLSGNVRVSLTNLKWTERTHETAKHIQRQEATPCDAHGFETKDGATQKINNTHFVPLRVIALQHLFVERLPLSRYVQQFI